MYAILSKHLDFSDEPQPKHDECIDREWDKRDDVRLIFLANLVRIATNFAKTGDLTELEDLTYTFHIEIPKLPEPSYQEQAEEDTKNLILEHFLDEIVEKLIDDGEASDDMYNDYDDGDLIFHETIVDRGYRTDEAIELLNDLYKHEEDDSGLWEGLDWEEILSTKAAYTYGNAVMAKWNELIEEINEIDPTSLDITWNVILEMIDKHPDKIEDLEIKLEDLSGDDYDNIEIATDYYKDMYEDEWNDLIKEHATNAIKELIK